MEELFEPSTFSLRGWTDTGFRLSLEALVTDARSWYAAPWKNTRNSLKLGFNGTEI